MRRALNLLATATTIACALSGGVAAGAAKDPVTDAVRLRFDDTSSELGAAQMAATNRGYAEVRAEVRTLNGGAMVSAAARDGQGHAVRFPAAGEDPSPVAVLGIWNTTSDDALSPGARNFAFGADFRLDGTLGASEFDNGDNLVQRGLADDAGQYKIEIDKRVPACSVAGTAGHVTVRSEVTVNTEGWYRVKCERSGSTVSIAVGEYGPDGSVSMTKNSVEAPTGHVATASPSTPMTVGGKMTPTGEIATWSPDQFNGHVDNVFLRMDG
ncbi:hypothetical protein [Georgenia sp. AZ-5]|uniref:hypothetical protein n=1 Tax=Georgenia sp. AZ-5 TaxID=3367526 RepID=UPI003754534A